jgi:hypothetical protein
MHAGGAALNAELWAPPNANDTKRLGNHADVANIINLLDAAKAGGVVFPNTAHDPFQGGNNLNQACTRVKGGTPGVFTLRLYFIQYSWACDQAVGVLPNGQNEWNDYAMYYVVKVLASPEGELRNLEELKLDLAANGYAVAGGGAGGLPAIVVPTGNVSYLAPGAIRRHLTIMPVAAGRSLADWTAAMVNNGARIDNPPWNINGVGGAAKASAQNLYNAWRAVGTSLGLFHYRFMADRVGGAILRNTVVHGDFHQENVFVDGAGVVSFIDAESMAGTMHAYIANGNAAHAQAAPWFDFIRPFNFSCCLDNMALVYARLKGTNVPPVFSTALLANLQKRDIADITIKPFLDGYITAFFTGRRGTDAVLGAIGGVNWEALKREIWADFNHTAGAMTLRMTGKPPGAKTALYSPARYHNWKKKIAAYLNANQGVGSGL